jgi:putative photosynthetic complex assembly protein
MSDAVHHQNFPRSALIFAGGAIAISLVAATVGRLTDAANSAPTAAVVTSRQLMFQDQANGGVAVFDVRNMAVPIEIVAPETNGFLRGTVRGLAQERKRAEVSLTVPFRLTEWADGRLTLEDPTTGRRVEMEAFGVDNEAAFAQILTLPLPAKQP